MVIIGTSAWFFFVVNWLKVPFSASLDLMTLDSVKLNLMMLPLIALGAVAGILFLLFFSPILLPLRRGALREFEEEYKEYTVNMVVTHVRLVSVIVSE